MAVFLMIFPLKWVHMIIILTSNEIQFQKSISEDVIGFLSILDFLSPLRSYPFFCSRLDVYCFFVIQYFDSGISQMNSPWFLVNHGHIAVSFWSFILICQHLKEEGSDLQQKAKIFLHIYEHVPIHYLCTRKYPT